MSWNNVTKARAKVGSLIVGNPVSDGGKGLITGTAIETKGIYSFSASVTGTVFTAGQSSTQNITGLPVSVGDKIDAIPPAGIVAGVVWSAYVSAAGTITIRILSDSTARTVVTANWTFIWTRLV